MIDTLLEKHADLVVEIAHAYLEKMAQELGKKYKDTSYEVNTGLSDEQYVALQAKHDIDAGEFGELYAEFLKMKPSTHLMQVMAAFTKSGGNVDIEPVYDEENQRLDVSVGFSIDGKSMERIEGLSEIEGLLLKMDAMIQIDTVLSKSEPGAEPAF